MPFEAGFTAGLPAAALAAGLAAGLAAAAFVPACALFGRFRAEPAAAPVPEPAPWLDPETPEIPAADSAAERFLLLMFADAVGL